MRAVTIPDELFEKAGIIGLGNKSLGIRIALSIYQLSDYEKKRAAEVMGIRVSWL